MFYLRALLLFALLPGCADVGEPSSAGLRDILDSDDVSIRFEGHWTQEELAAVVAPCNEWNHFFRSPCHFSPTGSILVAKGPPDQAPPYIQVFGLGARHVVFRADDPDINPRFISRVMRHAIPSLAGVKGIAGCSVMNDLPDRYKCWNTILPIDVDRCREDGVCR